MREASQLLDYTEQENMELFVYWIQNSQTGDQPYSDTSPIPMVSVLWLKLTYGCLSI